MKKLTSLIVCLIAFMVSCTKQSTVIDNKPAQEADNTFSLLANDYILMFEDDFSSDNKDSKGADYWASREGSSTFYAGFPYEFTGYNRAANNSLSNGVLDIAFNKDPDGKYYGGGLMSNTFMGYGYYETRVKIYTGSYGLHQSFWSNTGNVEIDGVEIDSRLDVDAKFKPGRHIYFPTRQVYKPTTVQQNAFVKNPNTSYGSAGYLRQADGVWDNKDVDTTKWHTIGYEWMPATGKGTQAAAGSVKYYVDGVLHATYDETDESLSGINFGAFQPAKLYITAIPYAINRSQSMVDPLINAKMQVDYVRYYTKKYPNVNLLGNQSFDYTAQTTLDQNIQAWTDYALYNGSTLLYSDGGRAAAYVEFLNNNWVLSHQGTSNYTALTRQTISYVPAGSYSLSLDYICNIHATGTGNMVKAVVLNAGDNKEIASMIIPATTSKTTFSTLTIPDILLTSTSKITVLLYSKANANEYVRFDNVRFFANP